MYLYRCSILIMEWMGSRILLFSSPSTFRVSWSDTTKSVLGRSFDVKSSILVQSLVGILRVALNHPIPQPNKPLRHPA